MSHGIIVANRALIKQLIVSWWDIHVFEEYLTWKNSEDLNKQSRWFLGYADAPLLSVAFSLGEETGAGHPCWLSTLWLLCSQIKCPWCSHPMPSILSPPSSPTVTSTFLQDHIRHTSHQMSTPNKVRTPAFPGLFQKTRSHISSIQVTI